MASICIYWERNDAGRYGTLNSLTSLLSLPAGSEQNTTYKEIAMPSVSSVNLSFLKNNIAENATALIRLAELSKGPLRVEKKIENGVTVKYLGVRSWSTYFFEKLIATRAQKTEAKINTQVAIEQHVRSFLNNTGLIMEGRSADGITASLHSRATGRLVTPPPVFKKATGGNKGTAILKKDASTEDELRSARFTTTLGKVLVPTGFSLAVVSPLQVIADVRLVTEKTHQDHSGSDKRLGMTVSQGVFINYARGNPDDYKKQYLASLNGVAKLVESSVVLEVQPGPDDTCSESNLAGARQAAIAFIRTCRLQDKEVSVMLTAPALPTVKKTASSTIVEIPTNANRNAQNITGSDSENEISEEEQSF